MSASDPGPSPDERAAHHLRRGSVAAIAGTLLALAAPTALLALARAGAIPLSAHSTSLAATAGTLVVLGGVLVLVAFFLYRRAFSNLKRVDRRLRPISVICLVGTVGALALIVGAAAAAGGSSAISSCLAGPASHALSCLKSKDPSAGYLSAIGFWLVWAGAAAVAAGLLLSGKYYRRPAISAGGALDGVLVALLVVPFVGLLVHVPYLTGILAATPVVAVASAVLVYVGAREARPTGG